MNSKELRIGNYFTGAHESNAPILQVKSFYENGVHSGFGKTHRFDLVLPIQLTEEWFIKLGGIKDEYNDIYIQHPTNENLRFYMNGEFIQKTKSHCCPISNYKHIDKVHLFQNFYFFDTGKELEIK